MKRKKNRVVRLRNIPNGKLEFELVSKPLSKFWPWALIGIIFVLFDLVLVGIAFLSMFFIVVFFLKEEKIIEIFDRFLLLYDGELLEDKKVTLIYYEDIINWSINDEQNLKIITNDYQEYLLKLPRTQAVRAKLEELLPDKKV